MKVQGDYWFTDMRGGTVGIVTAIDEATGERKTYIGVGEGYSQEADRQFVLTQVQKLPLPFLEGLVRWLKPKKKAKRG